MAQSNNLISKIKEELWDNPRNRSGFLAAVILILTIVFLVFNYFEKTGDKNLFPADEEKITQDLNQENQSDTGEVLSDLTINSEENSLENNYSTYTVIEGDSLWSIAKKELNDPYRWKEIADLNQIVPTMGGLYVVNPGDSLKIPQQAAAEHVAVTEQNDENQAEPELAETGIGNSPIIYSVHQGDTLWEIAQQIYGRGDLWHLIDEANTLGRLPNGNPLIHGGNQLICPRL
ncbi:hypothetical protein COS81_00975 [candidate division WWE3 bacterium CG06_land_8_20_14_3_00_42_16]|uniref:LysM domain-containing protein n=3 Tax=Katanobacteria TaxID=422282 RepID=A0A2M7AP99_UNCKA|nr:MAG: hypothetical protein COS81_00975 [candidate division WWE3 bacterium CG06_land_8_20_14_3_00_42_16]PIZ42737.1 MAG: hypothetical protein COY34_02295 [candidate division WWE3 bacterium CG_4_10_14_0_2_um_filter_42_8]